MSIQLSDAPANSAPNKTEAKASSSPEYNGNIPCDLIVPDPNNRDRIDPQKIKDLSESIKTEGLLQPICVRVQPDGKYMLIAGERRWRAHVLLKRPTIAGRIYRNQDAMAAARKKTVENFQREGLTPIEEAKKYKELADLGMKQKDIGALLGRSQPVIANALRLLELLASVQKLISEGKLTMAHGVSLARFSKWPKACERMAELTIDRKYTSKDLDQERVPFGPQLDQDGIICHIRVGERMGGWDVRRYYTIPPIMAKLPTFVRTDSRIVCCLEPVLWKDEKARQDKELDKKEAEEAKREAGRQSKMSPAEKAERQKKIAENKRKRAEIDKAVADATRILKSAKGVHVPAIAVLVSAGVCENFKYDNMLPDAAAALEVKVPKGEPWQADPALVLRIAAMAVLLRKADEARRYQQEVPKLFSAIVSAKSGGAKAKKK